MIYILSCMNKYSHFIYQTVCPSSWFKNKRKIQLGIIAQVREVAECRKTPRHQKDSETNLLLCGFKRSWGERINSDIWAKIWTFGGRKAYGLIFQGSAWIFCWPGVRSGLLKLDLSSWYEDPRGKCNYKQLHHISVIPPEAPVPENIPGWIIKSCLTSSVHQVSRP